METVTGAHSSRVIEEFTIDSIKLRLSDIEMDKVSPVGPMLGGQAVIMLQATPRTEATTKSSMFCQHKLNNIS